MKMKLCYLLSIVLHLLLVMFFISTKSSIIQVPIEFVIQRNNLEFVIQRSNSEIVKQKSNPEINIPLLQNSKKLNKFSIIKKLPNPRGLSKNKVAKNNKALNDNLVRNQKSENLNFQAESLFKTYNLDSSIQAQLSYLNKKQLSHESYSQTRDSEFTDWGEGGDEFGRISQTQLYLKIFENLQSIVFYPSVLSFNRIEGEILTRIIIDSEGKCRLNKTVFKSNENHLKLLAIDFIFQLCKENYKKYIAEKEQTVVDISFQFEISENNNPELYKSKNFTIGNTIHVYRNRHDSKARIRLGPLTAMFPLPMVSLDFEWILYNYEKYIEGHDPLKVYKDQF